MNYDEIAKRLSALYHMLAINLVEHTTDLRINPTVTLSSIIVAANCADTDYGRLIGKQAAMHTACQLLLRKSLFSTREKRIDLIIDCPKDGVSNFSRFRAKDEWDIGDDTHLASLLREAASALYSSPTVTSRRISNSASHFTLQLNAMGAAEINEAIDIWFTSVGRNRGRMVYLDVA